MPLAPDLGGGEHAAGTAHVTESGLAGTVSTTAGDTGDTGNSATYFRPSSAIAQFRNRASFSIRRIFEPASIHTVLLPLSISQKPLEKPLTSAPRLSRGLVTSLLADGVRLPLVLGHAGVDVLDDIRADGGAEDLGEDLSGAGGLAIGADDGNCGTGGHLVRVSGQVRRLQKRRKLAIEIRGFSRRRSS